jgi:hypothetical protein
METKVCTKCGVGKPATREFFYKDNKRKDKLNNWCKDCKRKSRPHHRGRNASDLRKKAPTADRASHTEYMREWRANQPAGKYEILNLKNGKIYIGVTSMIRQRWSNHKSHLKRNIHRNKSLQEDFNKYGVEVFEFTILEQYACNTDRMTLQRAEQEEIQRRTLAGQDLYNIGSPGHRIEQWEA